MTSNYQDIQTDSTAWQWFVRICFVTAAGAMIFGISVAPIDLWIRGYFLMGTLFLVGATLMLSKTIRDQFEAERAARMAARAREEAR